MNIRLTKILNVMKGNSLSNDVGLIATSKNISVFNQRLQIEWPAEKIWPLRPTTYTIFVEVIGMVVTISHLQN